MTYELALKLKEAGFPQHAHCDEFCERPFGPTFCTPTLSELIEACGDRFACLTRNRGQWDKFGKERWWADGVDLDEKGTRSGKGSTPEEAFANLWLELNKK